MENDWEDNLNEAAEDLKFALEALDAAALVVARAAARAAEVSTDFHGFYGERAGELDAAADRAATRAAAAAPTHRGTQATCAEVKHTLNVN